MKRLASQLTLSITLVVLVGVSIFSWLAYREVRTAALASAGQRLQEVAPQLVGLLAPSAPAIESLMLEYATDPTLAAAVAGDGPVTDPLRERLRELSRSNPQIDAVELWTASGVSVFRVRRDETTPPSPDVDTFPRWLTGESAAISAFGTDGEAVWYDIAAPARRAAGTVGFVVQRRLLSARPAVVQALSDLVGMQASILVGTPGGVWTDLSGVAEAPPEATTGETLEYQDASGTWRVGAGNPIAGTPWVAWVSSPQDAVLARADAFLVRIVPIAAAMVIVGGLVVWLLIRSFIAPLHRLTDAATALAGGQYERVPEAGPLELSQLAAAFNRMAESVEEGQRELERRVSARTDELEAFTYSVSHDLRAPLRAVHGYSHALVEDLGDSLQPEARHYVDRISAGVHRMGRLIDDLLELSRVTRVEMSARVVRLDSMADEVVEELGREQPDRRVECRVAPGLRAFGDPRLLRMVLQNLLENAWKFTSRKEDALIEVGSVAGAGDESTFYVRDNGAGFDMAYADKLFGVFERLHPQGAFPGTGVGLAIVHRIVQRHGGRVWADGKEAAGATFYVSLPAPSVGPNPSGREASA